MILSIKPEKAGRMESAITSSFFLGALVSLVVITNPLTKIPLFLSLTEGWSSGRRRSEAAHAALDAFFIMVASLVAGNLLLTFFGISYGAMRIAGGFVVAVIGHIRPDVYLERFVNQSPEEYLIAPKWGIKNYEFVAKLEKRLRERGEWQGRWYRGKSKR